MAGLTKRDLRMFKLSCQMELSMVAIELEISRAALDSRFAWIRKKRTEWQNNINRIVAAEKMCGKLRALLTPRTEKKK